MSKAAIVPFVPRRKPDGSGYQLIMLEPELTPPLDDAETTARWMNAIVENALCSLPSSTCGCIAASKPGLRASLLVINLHAVFRAASCFSFKAPRHCGNHTPGA